MKTTQDHLIANGGQARPGLDSGNDRELVERLSDEADLCANEGADDIARLLNEAAACIARLIAAKDQA